MFEQWFGGGQIALSRPTDVALKDGKMLISDSGNNRVVLLTMQGEWIGSFGAYQEESLGSMGQRVLQAFFIY